MQRPKTKTAAFLAAGAVLAGMIGAADASAAGTACTYNPSSGIADLRMISGGPTELERDGGTFKWFDAFGSGTCTAPDGQIATNDNTSSILFEGHPGTADDFIVSTRGGLYKNTHGDQIPVNVLSGGEDTVDVLGTEDGDIIAITGGKGTGKQGGVLVNGLGFTQPGVTLFADPALLRISGFGGNDWIGYPFLTSPTSMHLELRGGRGKDTLVGGLLGGDRLQGDEDDDTFDTADGQPGDNITGGTGQDTAKMDRSDQAFGVEKFQLPAVGRLAVAPRLGRLAANGNGRLKVAWKHPHSWKRLRSIAVSAYDGKHRVGSIVIHPRSRSARAHGGFRLRKRTAITHRGKWARGDLRFMLAPKLARHGLRLDVTATALGGRRQTQRAAGTLNR